MSSAAPDRLSAMSTSTHPATTVTNLGVAMFTVADQDAALAYYRDKLGFEVRADERFGPEGEARWLEVAPPGSTARLALNPPMTGTPGGGSIGVETPDLQAEYARLRAIDGVEIDDGMMHAPGVPPMFSVRDPDGNHIWVVEP
jgi:catechol 2,3-dioxygenase-like lactoylglutathione lyase family enzyme